MLPEGRCSVGCETLVGVWGLEGYAAKAEGGDLETLLSAALLLMGAVRQTNCSQPYFVGCPRGSKLLGFLIGKQTSRKAYPLSLAPCRGS